MTTLKAHDGLELPAIGFGTYNLRGSAGADAIAGAIERGYTLLDSAFNYENEGCVGRESAVVGPTVKISSSPRSFPGATRIMIWP